MHLLKLALAQLPQGALDGAILARSDSAGASHAFASDPDSPNLSGAAVQITDGYVNGEDILALPAQPHLTGSFDLPSGRLTLSGTASVADYETALEAVTYANTSDNPSMLTRTVIYAARDAGGFGLSDTHAITIAAVDDPPLAVDDGATVLEDSPAGAVSVAGQRRRSGRRGDVDRFGDAACGWGGCDHGWWGGVDVRAEL